VPASVHIPTLILISINYFVLYFASQTYSEALFFFLQSLLFWYFGKNFADTEHAPSYKNFIVLGLLLFLLAITRNIGLVAVMAVLAYFILKKQWKFALLSLIGFAIFFLDLKLLNESSGIQQAYKLLRKDPA
jgi:membrane-associated phospholipid phosphatase